MRFRVVAVAVVVVAGVLMSGVSASGASCMDGLGRGPGAVVTDPGTRLPVIAVHGWRSSASVWDVMGAQLSTLGENPPALSRFDYSHVNDQWVTHPDIGPRLAEWIDCLAEVSLVSGGSGRVALVGHSMGGLAIRAALDGDGARAAKVAFIATLGTPHQGSVFGGDWSLNDDLRSIGGALGDMLIEWVTMHGPAKAALGAGSRELASLPAIPSGPPVLAAAGNLILESRVLFWTSSQPVGDGLVGQASATAQNAQVGNLGGTDTMECRIATTLTGVAPTDLFSAPPFVLHQVEQYGWNCIHTKLPQSPHVINALAAQLAAAARTPSIAQDIEGGPAAPEPLSIIECPLRYFDDLHHSARDGYLYEEPVCFSDGSAAALHGVGPDFRYFSPAEPFDPAVSVPWGHPGYAVAAYELGVPLELLSLFYQRMGNGYPLRWVVYFDTQDTQESVDATIQTLEQLGFGGSAYYGDIGCDWGATDQVMPLSVLPVAAFFGDRNEAEALAGTWKQATGLDAHGPALVIQYCND